MISALCVSLAITLIPIGMIAAFFVCYALLYPMFWAADVTPAGKAFQVGATIIVAATGFLLRPRARLRRHPWLAASLLASSLIVIVFTVTVIFTGLGRF
jgi:hypothetical protein